MTVKRPPSLTPQLVWWLASLLLPLASQAQDYTYDALHRLATVTTTDGQVWSYHYDAAGNLLQVTANDTPPPPCLLYGVHDANRSDSQLVTVNPSQNFAVKLLGELHRHYDLEALDIHPLTHQLYAASGADGLAAGSLYTVNSDTGELTWVGASGFGEINGLSFRADGSLWGWATDVGLIQLDPQTGQGTVVMAATGTIEDLSWDNEGVMLYAVAANQLWAFNSQTQWVSQLSCTLPNGKLEALEMLPEGDLLFAIHQDRAVSLHALSLSDCTVVSVDLPVGLGDTTLNDIEGLAWPSAACSLVSPHFGDY